LSDFVLYIRNIDVRKGSGKPDGRTPTLPDFHTLFLLKMFLLSVWNIREVIPPAPAMTGEDHEVNQRHLELV